jgi:hypothetical protein
MIRQLPSSIRHDAGDRCLHMKVTNSGGIVYNPAKMENLVAGPASRSGILRKAAAIVILRLLPCQELE